MVPDGEALFRADRGDGQKPGGYHEVSQGTSSGKNTVLVFMSDNGGLAISGRLGNEEANYPLSFGKGSCMEGGIREPMIVSWPGVTKGDSRCAVPVVIDDFSQLFWISPDAGT